MAEVDIDVDLSLKKDDTFLTGMAGAGDEEMAESTALGEDLASAMATTTEGGAFRTAGLQLGAVSSTARPFQSEELSARKEDLIKEAQMRAEHQAHARTTMLTLADALDEASVRRRELEVMVVKEQAISGQLRDELATWQPKLDKALAEIQIWRDKMVFWAVQASVREGCFFPFLLWMSFTVRPIGERRSITGATISAEESQKIDRILLKQMMQCWREQSSPDSTLRKVSAAKHAEEVRLLKEQLVTERERQAKLLAAEKLVVKDLDAKLTAKSEEVIGAQRRIRELEDEKINLIDKVAAAEAKHKAEVEALRAELAKVPGMLAEKDAAYALLQQALKEAEEAILTAKADGEAERQALKARIQELAAELQKSLQSAKHMKETAQKAKREATGCISPEKFAQLIAELEETRDKMSNLGSERDNEKDLIDSLKLQLGQNRRRLELERQFLPLLHKVRGPIGPQNRMLKGKKDAPWASKTQVTMQLDPQPGQNDRLRHSQSAGAIDMSGMQGDPARRKASMASTDGFRNFRGGALPGM